MTHLHCGSGPACLLTQHSATPHFSGTAAVCSFLCSNDGHGQQEALVGRRLTVPPLTPSVSSACALMSPICAYFIALWLPDGRMQNDYITSTRLFSADTRWVLRNLMLPMMTRWQLQSGRCHQTTNAVDLLCIMFAAFGQYHMWVLFQSHPISNTARYHEILPILSTRYRYHPSLSFFYTCSYCWNIAADRYDSRYMLLLYTVQIVTLYVHSAVGEWRKDQSEENQTFGRTNKCRRENCLCCK